MYPRPFPYGEAKQYPFTERSSLNLSATVKLPADFIADVHIYADSNELYGITRLIKKQYDLTVYIGTRSKADVIVGQCDLLKPEQAVELYDIYGRNAGMLVFGSKEAGYFIPDGTYAIDPSVATFEVACHVVLNNDGVAGFIVNDELVTGDVEFIGGLGVTLERKENEVFIHFVGEPYYSLWQASLRNSNMNFDKWMTGAVVTVNNTLQPERSTTVMLVPDENGNIPIYTNNVLLDGNTLRITGTANQLDIGLAGK